MPDFQRVDRQRLAPDGQRGDLATTAREKDAQYANMPMVFCQALPTMKASAHRERTFGMRVACYLRTGATGRGQDRQRDEILRWLARNEEDQSEVEWYSDQGPSTAPDRPGFGRLQRDILDDRVKEVVLWKLGHIARRFKDVATTLASWCERGVKVVVVGEEIELSSEAGQGVSSLLRGLTKTETQFRRERQRAGITAARKRGVYPGRKRGTTKGKPAQALKLRDQGLTAKEIAEALGVSERTVFRYLGTKEEKKRPVAKKGAKP